MAMKSRFCILTNLHRLVYRTYTPHRAIPPLTTYSTKCLTEPYPPKDQQTQPTKTPTDILKTWGFTEADLSILFSRNPAIKNSEIASLETKLSLLSGLGIATSDLIRILNSRPRFLSCRLNRCFNDRLKFFATLFDTKASLAKAIVQNPSLLLYDFHSKIVPVVELYKSFGLTKRDLAAMLVHRPTLIPRTSFNPEKLAYVTRIGASPSSKLFKYVVTLVGISRVETIKEKVANFVSFGLSEDEVLRLIGRSPLILTLSVEKVERNLSFVMGMLRLPVEIVLRNPCLLYLNLEGVMRPRVLLAEKMREMGVEKGIDEGHMITALRMSEERFVKTFLASQPGEVRVKLAGFYAKVKRVKRLGLEAKEKKSGGFPF